jgi:hypothetical protein
MVGSKREAYSAYLTANNFNAYQDSFIGLFYKSRMLKNNQKQERKKRK